LEGKFIAFCGLGNPANFFKQLSIEGLDVVVKKTYPDHHFYRQADMTKLERLASSGGATALLTTAKDAVKLADINFALPCFVVETRLLIDRAKDFQRLVTSSS
jgi:tetraacyldisaccharide 4'-kinase